MPIDEREVTLVHICTDGGVNNACLEYTTAFDVTLTGPSYEVAVRNYLKDGWQPRVGQWLLLEGTDALRGILFVIHDDGTMTMGLKAQHVPRLTTWPPKK